MNLLNKIKSLIRRVRVSLSLPDTGDYPKVQVTYLGKTGEMEVIWPYGMGGRLPVDAIPLCFNVEGMEENKAGIGTHPTIRFKVDAEGETWNGNPLSGSVTYYRENGDIEIIGKNNKTVTIDGDMNITTGSDVNVNAGGNVNVTSSGTATVTAPTMNLIGNVNITGALVVTGSVAGASGAFTGSVTSGAISLTTHTHPQGLDSRGDSQANTGVAL